MKITSEFPQTWQQLQELVCKYLNEAGYQAESPKTIETVRGDVEVDVFATAPNELLRTFVCECKYWNTAVPKEKIHAFRTVVQDSGAMLGIFIAKEGYQSGAIEAARCSNVLLKDWPSFIRLIEDQWILHRLLRLKRVAHPLSVYTDPLDAPLEQLDKDKRAQYNLYQQKYLGAYLSVRRISKLALQQEFIAVNDLTFTACNELFDYLENECKNAVAAFSELFQSCTFDTVKLQIGGYMLFEIMDELFDGRIRI